jgi:hypothetical protein
LLLAVLGSSALACLIAAAPSAAAAPRPVARAADWYNAAQRDFHNSDVPAGLAALNQALTLAPDNTNVLALRAFWASQQRDYPDLADSLARLGAISPGKRAAVLDAIGAVRAAAAMTPDPFPSVQGPQTAIVVLGYGLRPDGSMRPELVDRLRTAWLEAVFSPRSPIITTGGNPRHGVAEGQAMAAWLIAHGIPAGRVFPETRADSTVQNALFSARIIHAIGASSAVVVTSANHVRRGTADVNIAGVPVVGQMATTDHLAAQLLPLPPSQQWGMYVDATKVFGLPTSM